MLAQSDSIKRRALYQYFDFYRIETWRDLDVGGNVQRASKYIACARFVRGQNATYLKNFRRNGEKKVYSIPSVSVVVYQFQRNDFYFFLKSYSFFSHNTWHSHDAT
jgi:hypothetical protein